MHNVLRKWSFCRLIGELDFTTIIITYFCMPCRCILNFLFSSLTSALSLKRQQQYVIKKFYVSHGTMPIHTMIRGRFVQVCTIVALVYRRFPFFKLYTFLFLNPDVVWSHESRLLNCWPDTLYHKCHTNGPAHFNVSLKLFSITNWLLLCYFLSFFFRMGGGCKANVYKRHGRVFTI